MYSPRVRTYDAQWCWFKDANNEFCIEGNQDWTVGFYNLQDYSASAVNGISPHIKAHLSFNSTQSLTWSSTMSLNRFWYSSMNVALTEFTSGYRLETVQWLDSYTTCLNFIEFSSPISMSLTVNNKYEECYKVLINCMDDFSIWTGNETALLDWATCKLSTGADYTFYKYEPIPEMRDHYYFGDSSYNNQICWPGFTPLSNLDKYPDNPVYAIYAVWLLYRKYVENQALIGAPNLLSWEGL